MLYSFGVSIGQSRFICQVLCTGLQGISVLLPGGPSAKVGLAARFCVLVFKASMLYSFGGSIGQSRFICQVLCTGLQGISVLLPGGPSAKVGLAARFCVLVFKASMLYSFGGSIGQSRFICQVSCIGLQGISVLLQGGPSAKVIITLNNNNNMNS